MPAITIATQNREFTSFNAPLSRRPILLAGSPQHYAWVCETKQRIAETEQIMRSLQLLLHSIWLLRNGMREDLTAIAGLLRLPNEILTRIISLDLDTHISVPGYGRWHFGGQYDAFYVRQLFSLSSVCKRFRNIIEHTPAFWTYISSSIPERLVESFLRRSQNADIHVCFEIELDSK